MLQLLWRWKIVVIVLAILAVAGTIHLTSLTRPRLSFFEELFRDVLAPVQTGIMRVNRQVGSVFTAVSEWRQIYEHNKQLEEEVRNLQQQVYQLAEYKRENQWLREALDFKEEVGHQLMVAEVIGRSPSNWLSMININRGSKHGVTQGMPVVTGTGIVGTVHSVSSGTATVMLMTDPASAVGGIVQASGDVLLVEGNPDLSGRLVAKPLTRDVNINIGDVVVTSGLSRLFPKGLPIGEVVEIIPGRYDLSLTLHIEPFVDFTRLEYVSVVVQEQF